MFWFAAAIFLEVTVAAGADAEAAPEATPEPDRLAAFREQVLPILVDHCFDCHGYGSAEGGLSLEELVRDDAMFSQRSKWWAVLKNLRAGVMPPQDFEAPSEDQQRRIADWIKQEVFAIDVESPDPGPATVRRLNRSEYGHAIKDLMGIDFNVEIMFPPEDTGFGFDNVGDALTTSPLLLEKYLEAAKLVVEEAVPTESQEIAAQRISGDDFRTGDGQRDGSHISFKQPGSFSHKLSIDESGTYQVIVNAQVRGSFDFDPGRCSVEFSIDGERRHKEKYRWQERQEIALEFDEQFAAGEHALAFELIGLPPDNEEADDDEEFGASNDSTNVQYEIRSVQVVGPLDPPRYEHPPNYHRFFPRDAPPESLEARREYAQEVLQRFVERAYRSKPDEATIQRLTELAEQAYRQPGKTFEAGVAQAMAAVLASPRFLLRIDAPALDSTGEPYPLVDQYALASRLSFFLWSTMPDDELLQLARQGELRTNLDAQVQRMLMDPRAKRMTRSFAGQWLRARDVEHVSIDPLEALGLQQEWDEMIAQFRRRGFRRSRDRDNEDPDTARRRERFQELREVREMFSGDVRRAMRRETEMLLEHIIQQDRSVLELLDADYAFLNEPLAEYYGIEGVEGKRMRKVQLPQGSPRGGVLTQGTMLTVTSNPTRTSPVKRGLYVLENILGTPPLPPPPDVPELEAASDRFGDREPTLRELLAAHREDDLCSSCHSRMDPLGIALENFNALGQWRDEELGEPIDASGELISGEQFSNIQELKQILRDSQRTNFYRCLAEKLLTYALGRGLDYHDVHTVDQIVDQLERSGGQFSSLLSGIVQSAPFQRIRRTEDGSVAVNDGVAVNQSDAQKLSPRNPNPRFGVEQ